MASHQDDDEKPSHPDYNWTYMNNNTANTTGLPPVPDDHGNMDKYLWMYWSPFTFLVGLVGNMFIVLVFIHPGNGCKTRRQAATTPIYLTLMAIADICFLIFGIVPEWLEACDFLVFNELHPITCKIEKYMFYTFGDVAIWIITAFTFDRFIAVCFPFKKRFVCVPKYAKIISVLILITALLKNLHVFWTRGPKYDAGGLLITNCGRPEPFTNFENYIRPWIAFALISLIPFSVILICNIFIIKALVDAKKNMAMTSSADKSFMQTIFMCLSASFAFLLCITPSMVLYIGKPYWTDSEHPNYAYDIAKAVNNQLVYVNHSINFFLYCITGSKFREEFVALFHKKQKNMKPSITSFSPTTRRKNDFDNGTKSYVSNNNNDSPSSRYIQRLQKQMKQDNGVLISGSTLSLDA